MKIIHLLDEAVTAVGRQANARLSQANQPNLRVEPGGKGETEKPGFLTPGGTVGAAASARRAAQSKADDIAANYKSTLGGGQNNKPAAEPTSAAATAAKTSPTGDATLDKPLPPKDPNAPGLGTKIGQGVGQAAKAVGAVGGGIAGIGRAIKKGFQAGADTVGGPGRAAAPAASSLTTAPSTSSAPTSGGAAGAVSDQEFNDLIARVQKLEQLLAMRR